MSAKRWDYLTPGIPDELFIRGEVPMTKAEVRAVTLSRLRLQPGQHVVDVGAGTGSVAIECALLLQGGRVTAVEKDESALELIRQNARAFQVENLEVVSGRAPGALAGLAPAQRIVIGGTGGAMREILLACGELLVPGGILVVNCILLQSLVSCLETLSSLDFSSPELVSLAVSRGERLAGQTMLKPLNPVFILAAEKKEAGR